MQGRSFSAFLKHFPYTQAIQVMLRTERSYLSNGVWYGCVGCCVNGFKHGNGETVPENSDALSGSHSVQQLGEMCFSSYARAVPMPRSFRPA